MLEIVAMMREEDSLLVNRAVHQLEDEYRVKWDRLYPGYVINIINV